MNENNSMFKCGPSTFEHSEDIKEFNPVGRFPANLLCSDDVLNDGNITSVKGKPIHRNYSPHSYYSDNELVDKSYIANRPCDQGSYSRYFDIDKWWAELLKQLEIDKEWIESI